MNKILVNLISCFIPKKKNRKHFRNKYSSNKYYCPYCKTYYKFLSYGTILRENVLCPVCNSLERTRFLYFVYEKLNLFTPASKIKILHFAPEKCLYDIFSNNPMIEYTCVDLVPENYPFAIGIKKEDGMNLSFDNKTFDFIIHNHVMEHVPNDKEFIIENLRVLKDDGKIIATFPFHPKKKCYFNDNIKTPEERLNIFYQWDHVRLYGFDFAKHLEDNKYNFEIIDFKKLKISKKEIKEMRLDNDDNDSLLKNACIVINKNE